MKPSSPSPSPPHGAAAVKQPASSPDARLTPSSVVAAAAVGIGVTPPRRSCDDAASCVVNDVDAFARTIASIRSKPASAAAAAASSSSDGGGDHLATVLAHYAARWLPDVASSPSGRFLLPPQSPTATWIRKRLLLESLVAALPPDGGDGDDGGGGVTCDFLLRLLRAGSMAGADAALLADLEARAARRLDQASLGAVMIPAFRAAAGDAPGAGATLLDVPLVLRLVRGFLREGGKAGAGGGGGGRLQGGEAGGRVPRRGGAGGRAAAGGVRGARARRAGARPRRRRRAVPRRRHLPQGAPARREGGEAIAVPADRRAQAHGGGGGARRPERAPPRALRRPGPLLRARQQAHPPRRVDHRLLPLPPVPQPRRPHRHRRRRQWRRAVPLQARGRRAAPRAPPPPRGRVPPPGAVPRAAGAGGQAQLGAPPPAGGPVQAAVRRRRWRWRHRGRRRGRLRQRVGQDAAEREEGRRRPRDRRGGGGVDAGVGHAGRGEVAQVALV
ncbi:hypothetical protein EE612_027462, partial [Oryza sativa]